MNTTRKKRQTVELSYDSFLDIVANLVGILIILVVVLGAQSSSRIEAIKQQTNMAAASRLAEPAYLESLTAQLKRTSAAQQDSDRLEHLIDKQQEVIDQRLLERDLLLDLLHQAEEEAGCKTGRKWSSGSAIQGKDEAKGGESGDRGLFRAR